MEDMIIETFRGESRIHTQSNCHVAVLDAEPLKQIREVNAPGTANKETKVIIIANKNRKL